MLSIKISDEEVLKRLAQLRQNGVNISEYIEKLLRGDLC